MSTLYQTVKEASIAVDDGRTPFHVLTKTMEEVGELAQEVLISQGVVVHKTPGVDGVVGEAVDAIITLLDLIHITNPDLTEEDLSAIAKAKTNKWLETRSNTNAVV